MKRSSSAITIAGMLLAAPFAPARSGLARADSTTEAKKHFAEGNRLYEDEAYLEAAVEYERAYAAQPNALVLCSLGQAHARVGRPVESVDASNRCLEGAADMPAEKRAVIRAEIERQRARIAHLTVRTTPPGATVRIDGRIVGTTPFEPPVPIVFGKHVVAVALDEYRATEASIDLAGGEYKAIEVALVAIPKPPAPRASAPRGRSQRTWSYVLGLGGIAVAGVASGVYIWNNRRYSGWQDENTVLEGKPPPPDRDARQAANDDLIQSIQRAEKVAVGLGVASAALMVAGVVLFATDSGERSGEVAVRSMGGDGWGVQWRGAW